MKNLLNAEKAVLAKMATRTYEGAHGIYEMPGMSSFEKHENGVNQWYTGVYKHPRIKQYVGCIAIRGSDQGSINPFSKENKNESDWKFNYDTKLVQDTINKGAKLVVPYGNEKSEIRMFRGTFEHAMLARAGVRDFVVSLMKDSIRHFYIAGHSLGGGDTTVLFADILYMIRDEMGLPLNTGNDRGYDLTGYAMSSPTVGNEAFQKSFDLRAGGNFYNEWFGNDTVHGTPTQWQGGRHVGIQKRYDDWVSIAQTPFVNSLSILSLGALPSLAAYDHYPQKVIAAIEGKPIPRFWDLK